MTDESLPKSHRLLSSADYKHVFADATPARNRMFTVLVRRNEYGHARLGLVVSRRVSRKAVIRNAVKRVVRETFRCHSLRHEPFDLVVIARFAASEASNDERTAAFAHVLRRLSSNQPTPGN